MTPAPLSLPGPGDLLAEEAAALVRERTALEPEVALVLGSGLSGAVDAMEEEASFSFEGLPGFPPTSVPGHSGTLVLGGLAGVAVAAFLGRIHFYEGHPMSVAGLPVRLARRLGAHTLVLTASVGSLVPELPAGAVVVGTDHINLMGENPLRGWRTPEGAPTFVDASAMYDHDLAGLAMEEAASIGLRAAPGVYVAVSGPSYETPAEIRFMREAGGTVVGMSVVPEVLPARALGMRVLGLFGVTNTVGMPVTHGEVMEQAGELGSGLAALLERVLRRIVEDGERARPGEDPGAPQTTGGDDRHGL